MAAANLILMYSLSCLAKAKAMEFYLLYKNSFLLKQEMKPQEI